MKQLRASFLGIAVSIVAWAAAIAQTPAQTVVTGQYVVTPSGFTPSPLSNTYDVVVRIKAPAVAVPVGAPFSFIVTSYSVPNISLQNRSGYTPDSKEKVDVPLANQTFIAGQTLNVLLKFTNPARSRFTYKYRIEAVNPDIGVPVEYTQNPLEVSFDQFPVNPETGRPIVLKLGDFQFEYDATRRDRDTAMAACQDWVASCFNPAVRTLDDCARSAPQCKTATPWLETGTCCPSNCYSQYRAKRLLGTAARYAFTTTYLLENACMP